MYRLVDSTLIFDTLYKLLNHGHQGYAQPGSFCSIDLPDDFFRIRLVSTLLETCGMYFEKGPVKKKLDFFLAFFQYYINTKDPIPMDIEFVVQDTFNALRPQWKLVLNDPPEASRVFGESVRQNYQETPLNRVSEPEEPEAEEHDFEGEDSDDAAIDGEMRPRSAEDGEGDEVHEDAAGSAEASSSDESEHIVVTRPSEQRDPEADAEFDRELAKLMSESVESRKFERKPMFDVPLPMRRHVREAAPTNADDSDNETPAPAPPSEPGKMQFSLLSKRGNRQQVSTFTGVRFDMMWTDNFSRHARLSCRRIPHLRSP